MTATERGVDEMADMRYDDECRGDRDCPATEHIHGCFAEGRVADMRRDRERAAEELMAAMARLLREAHKAWEPHQHDPEWDELSAALTAVYMGWKFAARTGLLPHGPQELGS